MKKLILLTTIILLISCEKRKALSKNFVDQILDVTIETSTDEFIEFSQLYDSLSHSIPDDNEEKLILVERLKQRGFKVSNSGRGNFPPLGPRIVIIELKRDNCTCEVSKKYYATVSDTLYQMTEGISCKKSGF